MIFPCAYPNMSMEKWWLHDSIWPASSITIRPLRLLNTKTVTQKDGTTATATASEPAWSSASPAIAVPPPAAHRSMVRQSGKLSPSFVLPVAFCLCTLLGRPVVGVVSLALAAASGKLMAGISVVTCRPVNSSTESIWNRSRAS